LPHQQATGAPVVGCSTMKLSFGLKVEGVDYYALTADEAITARFVTAVSMELASWSGVDRKALVLALSPGSVKIKVKVQTEDQEVVQTAHRNLAALNPAVLQAAVAQAVRSTQGIELIAVGPIRATGLSVGRPTRVDEEEAGDRAGPAEAPSRFTHQRMAQISKESTRAASQQAAATRAPAPSPECLGDDEFVDTPSRFFPRPTTNSKRVQNTSELGKAAVENFKALLRSTDRTVAAAWRRLFDPRAIGHVTMSKFCAACRVIGYKGSFRQLWRHLNKDGDGQISFSEVDLDDANALGVLRARMVMQYGDVPTGARSIGISGPRRVQQTEFCERITAAKLSSRKRSESLFGLLATTPGLISGQSEGVVDARSFEWLDMMGPYLPLPPLGRAEPGESSSDEPERTPAELNASMAESTILQKFASSFDDTGRVSIDEFTACLKDTEHHEFAEWIADDLRFHYRAEDNAEDLEVDVLPAALLEFYEEAAAREQDKQATTTTARYNIFEKLYREAKDWNERKQSRVYESEQPWVNVENQVASDPMIFERLYSDSKLLLSRRAQEIEERWNKQRELASMGAAKESDTETLARLMGSTAQEERDSNRRKHGRDNQEVMSFARRVHLWTLLPLEDLQEACDAYNLDYTNMTKKAMIQMLSIRSNEQGLEINQVGKTISARMDALHDDAKMRKDRLGALREAKNEHARAMEATQLLDGPRLIDLEVGDRVKAMEGRGFQKDGQVFYKPGDIGVVTHSFEKAGEERFQIWWDRTDKFTTIEKAVWMFYFTIMEKAEAMPEGRQVDYEALERLHQSAPHKRLAPKVNSSADGTLLCEQCNAKMTGDSIFCRLCGFRRSRPSPQAKPIPKSSDSEKSMCVFRLYSDSKIRQQNRLESQRSRENDLRLYLDTSSVHRKAASGTNVHQRLYKNIPYHKQVVRTRPLAVDMPKRKYDWQWRDDIRNVIANAASRCMYLCDSAGHGPGRLYVGTLLTELRGTEFDGFAHWMQRGRRWQCFTRDGGLSMNMPELRAALMDFYTTTGTFNVESSQTAPLGERPKDRRINQSPASGTLTQSRPHSADTRRGADSADVMAIAKPESARRLVSADVTLELCASCGSTLTRGSSACLQCGAPRAQSGDAVCPAGHTLLSFLAPIDSWPCSVCLVTSFAKGDRFMGCHECGYFMCTGCKIKADHKSRQGSRRKLPQSSTDSAEDLRADSTSTGLPPDLSGETGSAPSDARPQSGRLRQLGKNHVSMRPPTSEPEPEVAEEELMRAQHSNQKRTQKQKKTEGELMRAQHSNQLMRAQHSNQKRP